LGKKAVSAQEDRQDIECAVRETGKKIVERTVKKSKLLLELRLAVRREQKVTEEDAVLA